MRPVCWPRRRSAFSSVSSCPRSDVHSPPGGPCCLNSGYAALTGTHGVLGFIPWAQRTSLRACALSRGLIFSSPGVPVSPRAAIWPTRAVPATRRARRKDPEDQLLPGRFVCAGGGLGGDLFLRPRSLSAACGFLSVPGCGCSPVALPVYWPISRPPMPARSS